MVRSTHTHTHTHQCQLFRSGQQWAAGPRNLGNTQEILYYTTQLWHIIIIITSNTVKVLLLRH
jgi:hypothetical protein